LIYVISDVSQGAYVGWYIDTREMFPQTVILKLGDNFVEVKQFLYILKHRDWSAYMRVSVWFCAFVTWY